MSSEHVAVIADVIRSRSYPDRSAVQHQVEDLLTTIAETFPPIKPFTPTVGDELQAVYASRNDALAATLLAALMHQDGPQLRFGLGQGEVLAVHSGASEDVQDGPGWWRAREAIEDVAALQKRYPNVRSRFIGADAHNDAVINAYLLTRDHLVATMSVNARRYARGVTEGKSQDQIAAEVGVTQPAVSKSLRTSGAAELMLGLKGLAAQSARTPNEHSSGGNA